VADRPDLGSVRWAQIIGVGGAAMSAIATVLVGMGIRVTGSDAADSAVMRRLADAGVDVYVGHDPSRMGEIDLVAVSSSIPDDNVEVVEAVSRGLRIWRRSEVMAALCAERRTVAVGGTHGKTSTSSMLALILDRGGLAPSYLIGGDLLGFGPGVRWNQDSPWFVVEADESDGTFLALGAEAVIVTSVEADHLDHYGSEDAVVAAFERFVDEAAGPRVACADDAGAAAIVAKERGGGRVVTTYGTSSEADVRIVDVRLGRLDAEFGLAVDGHVVGPFHLATAGLHNVRNAAAALTMAAALGVGWTDARAGLAGYRGVARRFEVRGRRDGVTYIDDYGHLPGEVSAALATAAQGGWSRVVAVFQPHRYARTEALADRFADAFIDADVLVVTGVYRPPGEPVRPGVTGQLVVDAVLGAHPDADVRYAPTLDDAETELRLLLRPGDLCLTLGAGDLTTLPDRFVAANPGEGVR
jgi:UDP-N-acetylmuramate--alanine ligase